ncbi:hypothetical protein GF319_08710 [Candidatus Bathyarchaeota archaeon]|jgi:hypothetical protein|nr:hypothetical protein [Candidatus Bathyarchaeota archaeon]
MPKEINDAEEFIELSGNAEECRIKRNSDNTKLKLRTGKYLYTLKLDPDEVQSVISRLNCPTVEI